MFALAAAPIALSRGRARRARALDIVLCTFFVRIDAVIMYTRERSDTALLSLIVEVVAGGVGREARTGEEGGEACGGGRVSAGAQSGRAYRSPAPRAPPAPHRRERCLRRRRVKCESEQRSLADSLSHGAELDLLTADSSGDKRGALAEYQLTTHW
ncbi:unnamed protein product [Euphydryas editha]|uniref:Uncharacterized protein n=1 Tax=Euphydryas editha TaxID=104508 RepID=A0AAU9UJ69_EUPED|nr:unnamed protein product [Euphydryas editha]